MPYLLIFVAKEEENPKRTIQNPHSHAHIKIVLINHEKKFKLFIFRHLLISSVLCFVFLVFALAVVVFLLSTSQIQDIYSFTGMVTFLMMSYTWNQGIPTLAENQSPTHHSHDFYDLTQNAVTQLFLAYSFSYIWMLRQRTLPRTEIKAIISLGMMTSFMFPAIVYLVCPNSEYLSWVPVISMVGPTFAIAIEVFGSVRALVWTFRQAYNVIKITLSAIGIQGFV